MDRSEFDYVIVGAGSAGCVLACRLTEDPDLSVLLLEAGGADRDPLIHIPLGLGKLWKERRHDWGYDTEPQSELNGRRIPLPRGKVLGGSSSINAMMYVRGDRRDYDRWADAGASGWSYAHLLPYFKRAESWQGGETEYRGGGGPVRTRYSDLTDPIADALLEAARSAGHPLSEDYNAQAQEGFGRTQSTIDRGRRASAARAYLHPVRRRPNLEVRSHALATRVLMDRTTASGVEYLHRGSLARVHARCEVLVCAGAINSPQLLMLSGIGDADRLRAHGIASVAHLPGVGENLQDHVFARVGNFRNGRSSPLVRALRLDRIALAMLRAYFIGTGPATNPPGGAMGLIRSRPDAPVPDIQIGFRAIAQDPRPWWPGIGPRFKDAFFLLSILLHPRSRGTVELAGPDPQRPPRIRPNYLSAPEDAKTLAEGIRIAREIVRQPALDAYRGAEFEPGASVKTEAELLAFVRATASTLHHAACTCPMGADDAAVVDFELRVRGCERLRVIDASVMPDLVSGNINACVLTIAERAADLVRGRPPAAPQHVR